MTWDIALGVIALVTFVIAVMNPLMKLNSSITELKCTIENMNQNSERSNERITAHGKVIDELEHRVTVLEANSVKKERENK